MVKKTKLIVLVFLVLLTAVAVYYLTREKTPEDMIKEQLYEFLDNASKSAGDKLTTSLLKTKSIEKQFAPKCYFDVGVQMFSGTYSPFQISQNSMRCRAMFRHVKFSISDLEIIMTSSKTATVDFTGHVKGITKQGNAIDEYRELSCKVNLIEGKWLISSVNIRKILKK